MALSNTFFATLSRISQQCIRSRFLFFSYISFFQRRQEQVISKWRYESILAVREGEMFIYTVCLSQIAFCIHGTVVSSFSDNTFSTIQKKKNRPS